MKGLKNIGFPPVFLIIPKTIIMNKGTYNRKYYLHRRIKKAGLKLVIAQQKTIVVASNKVNEVKGNKYVSELQNNHSYGVQILNPLFDNL